jgi:LAO/AO transport system kinase
MPGPRWRPPILKTVATSGAGVADLVDAIAEHRTWMVEHGELELRRQQRAAAEIEAVAVEQLRARLGDIRGGSALPGLAKRVAVGELDPFTAADELVKHLAR